MNTPNLLFIHGLPRSGTTLLINWLKNAWPEPKIWLKESGILQLAYYTGRLFEFTAKNNDTGINFINNIDQRDAALSSLQNWIFDIYQIKSDVHNANWILDKWPIFFPGSATYYNFIIDLFPSAKIIYCVREPEEVIASMKKRSWSRGPYPKLNYMSPFIRDLVNFGPEELYLSDDFAMNDNRRDFLQAEAKWSFKKCCINYRNGLRGIESAILNKHDFKIIDYASLNNTKGMREYISDFAGVSLSCDYSFRRRSGAPTFSPEEQLVYRMEIVESGVLDLYHRLKSVSILKEYE